MENLTNSQKREILEKISTMDILDVEHSSQLQAFMSDYCFPKCIKKIYKRSDEIHTGELYCIRRCLWRLFYTRQMVSDYYRKQQPTPDYSSEIESMESEIETRYSGVTPNFAIWRQKAAESAQKERERIDRLIKEANERSQAVQAFKEKEQQMAQSNNHSLEARTEISNGTYGTNENASGEVVREECSPSSIQRSSLHADITHNLQDNTLNNPNDFKDQEQT